VGDQQPSAPVNPVEELVESFTLTQWQRNQMYYKPDFTLLLEAIIELVKAAVSVDGDSAIAASMSERLQAKYLDNYSMYHYLWSDQTTDHDLRKCAPSKQLLSLLLVHACTGDKAKSCLFFKYLNANVDEKGNAESPGNRYNCKQFKQAPVYNEGVKMLGKMLAIEDELQEYRIRGVFGTGRKEQGDSRGLIYRTIEWQQQNSTRYNDVSRLVNVMLKICEEIPKVKNYTSKLTVRLDSKFLSYLEAPLRKKNQKYKGLNIEQCKEAVARLRAWSKKK